MNPVKVTKGDKVTLRYQLREDGAAKDITGMSFKLAVKGKLSDSGHKISPVDGTIDDAAAGNFSFVLTSTETDQAPFRGLMEMAMYDGSGDRTTITPVGGLEFRLVEDIIDE